MGVYLNGTTAYTLYKSEVKSPYYVDKSQMLEELFPLVSKGNKHICITRPRRADPYDEIYYYIENNVDDIKEPLALMVSGVSVSAKIREYAATSMNLQTKDEVFSAMVVYGFLSYENGKVCIPNKELMEKFADMLQKEPSLGYVYRLAKTTS